MNMNEMQQCVRSYLFAEGSGYTADDWREMSSSAYFFINKSSIRVPLHIVLYDDCERVEVAEHNGVDKTVISVTNADELCSSLTAQVPTGERLDAIRRAVKDSIKSMRLEHIEAAEACVLPEDVTRLAAAIAELMRANLEVVSCTGRRNVVNKALYMLKLTLEATLPMPTEF